MGNELRRRALLPFFFSPPRLSACSNFNLRSFARVHKFFISCPIIDAWQKTQKPLLTAIKSIVRPHRRHLPPFPVPPLYHLTATRKLPTNRLMVAPLSRYQWELEPVDCILGSLAPVQPEHAHPMLITCKRHLQSRPISHEINDLHSLYEFKMKPESVFAVSEPMTVQRQFLTPKTTSKTCMKLRIISYANVPSLSVLYLLRNFEKSLNLCVRNIQNKIIFGSTLIGTA